MTDTEKQETGAQEEFKKTVMQCGATDYWAIGRTKDVRDGYPNLQVPHRLKALEVGWCVHCPVSTVIFMTPKFGISPRFWLFDVAVCLP